MDITYIGHSSFLLKTKDAKVVTDPFDPKMVGMSYPKTEADIVTISHHHDDHDNMERISGDPLVIDWPGEYGKTNVRITGFPSYHDNAKGAERGENTLFRIEMEKISVLHCGDLGCVLTDSEIDKIGNVDILLVPVGGHYTINAEEAAKVVSKVEPSIIIPMHYNHDKLNQDVFGMISPVDTFVKELAMEPTHIKGKYSIKADQLTDTRQLIIIGL